MFSEVKRISRASGHLQATILLGLLFGAWVSEAQNLAQNPGFETGDTSGWFAFGAPTISAQTAQVHSGIYAALIQNRTATYNGIAQSVQGVIQPGQPYNISGWVRLPSGAGQTIQMTMKKSDGNGDTYTALASGPATISGWTQLAGQYNLSVSGTLSNLVLYFEMPSSSTADFYVDDLSVTVANAGNAGTNGISTVNWTDVRQRIDGFGASSAWRSSWNSSVADMFFSTNTGIGLSLLRTRIAPGGTTVENSIMQMARDRGARVWSTPWSPAASFKTANQNGVISVNGGGFSGDYRGYASQLAGYVVSMENTYGVSLYALSIQNEPDFNTTNYESCVWTAQQFHDFVPVLSAALAASNVSATKIIIPESDVWSGDTNLYVTAMNDGSVAPLVSIIADHNYVQDNNTGDQLAPAPIPSYGKAVWETEVSTADAFDGSITNAMYWANRIHAFLTVPQVNAWHFWWLSANGNDNQGLASSSDVLAKRGYVLGQYSRFVRPDYYHIGVVTNQGTALVSAFKEPISLRFAIVAINSATNAVTQTFNLANCSLVSTVTPWITSSTLSLASQAAVAVTNSAFAYQLPAMSVVTFVGQASNSPPAIASVSNRTINAGITLMLTNTATDPDAPPQTLTFNLVQGPANATLNATNGIFTWRPLVQQAGSTNLVMVGVTDNGSPSLASTNRFTVTVNPLNRPALTSITAGSGQASLTIAGDAGPDYTVLTSTNLSNWQALFTTNPPALPITLVVTNGPAPQRFYRIQLGP
ncbi:MAG TPA: carbohydrate binding domain-containing protein [Candidatus Binatia bacterium]|nr:carbohydrate binding domain-containing protein [Candidatus Binatia bacterium]